MASKYIFRFVFHELNDGFNEEGVKIPFEFDSYEDALKEAKFYFDLFYGNLWREFNIQKNLSMTHEEILTKVIHIADQFELLPNESQFDFFKYAKERESYYLFEKSIKGFIR